MRRAGTTFAAFAAAPIVGATVLRECNPGDPSTWVAPTTTAPATTTSTTTTTTTTATTTAPPAAGEALAGYNVFSLATKDPSAVQGVLDMRPGMVRWNVEWDRYQSTSAPVDWSGSGFFLSALETVGATLYVQLWVQYAVPAWARTQTYQNIPKAGTFEQFLSGLEVFVGNFDIEVIWGMYNEADLRFGLMNIDGTLNLGPGHPENYHTPWTWSPLDALRGNALWTGGSAGEWDRLHLAGGSRVHTSNGLTKKGWIDRTAGHYQVVDLHVYMVGQDIDYYLTKIRSQMALWDAAKPGLPFVVGEIATASTPNAPGLPNDTPEEKGLIRARHEALVDEWGDRYMGMLSLSEGQRWNDKVGWWET